jgi:hypothetical protein
MLRFRFATRDCIEKADPTEETNPVENKQGDEEYFEDLVDEHSVDEEKDAENKEESDKIPDDKIQQNESKIQN